MTHEVLELRDVSGPSALGGGWRRALELLYLMAAMEFKRHYFGTVLGYLWSLCRPLLMFGVLLAVFTHVVRLGSQVPHYAVLLLFNIVLFGFFQEATTTAVTSVVSPLAVVLTSAFNLGLNLVVAFVFILGLGVPPRWSWLLLLVLLVVLFVLTIAVAMALSSLYPRFRDVAIIWAVAGSALFYATPVLYPLQKVSGTLGNLIALNPLTPLFELARRWVIDPRAPVTGGTLHVAVPLVLYVAICVAAVWLFNREAPRIAESL
jgi:ABC-2 type transport system permease protein